MATRDIFSPPENIKEYTLNLQKDLKIIALLEETHYLNGHPPVPKLGNIELAWDFSKDPAHHYHFINMLRVSPLVFLTVLDLIEDYAVFKNDTNLGQMPVEQQLAVTLFQLGRYGNGASVEDIAHAAGCSEGSVENYTNCCFQAILSLHSQCYDFYSFTHSFSLNYTLDLIL